MAHCGETELPAADGFSWHAIIQSLHHRTMYVISVDGRLIERESGLLPAALSRLPADGTPDGSK